MNDVERAAMEMQHRSRKDVDHANATDTATKHLEFVISKLANVSANTIPKGTIVKNAVQIIMAIRFTVDSAISNANHVEC